MLRRYLVTGLCSFILGAYLNGLRLDNKHNQFVIQLNDAKQKELTQTISKKDATIKLLLDQGSKISVTNNSLSATVGKLQQSIKQSNKRLQSRSESTKLVECQNLLSESTELLRQGAELSSKIALTQ